MSLFIASLNSGSNGNCYYAGNQQGAVLIDAGISCRETEKRMKRLGLSIQNVKAIFISHEHIDHIRGMQGIATKHNIPVYITAGTLKRSGIVMGNHLIKIFKAGEDVQIGTMKVNAFLKLHDAADPHSFTVSGNGVTIGVFTDIGTPCDQLISNFKKCHAAFLESNYDETMLDQGSYPIYMKNRIRGGQGHLSNRQALELFMTHRPAHMTHLLLSHLSQNNNTPELVNATFSPHAREMNIIIASRYNETELYEVHGSKAITPAKVIVKSTQPKAVQATLF